MSTYDFIWYIVSTELAYVGAVSLVGVAPALALGFWTNYKKSELHTLALHKWLFIISWLLIVLITGIIHWIVWNYGGMFAVQYIALSVLMAMPIVYGLF